MGLEDLEKLKEQLEQQENNNIESTNNVEEKVEEIKKDYSSFDNYSKKRVTLVGYLMGLKDEILAADPFNQEYLSDLRKDSKLQIFRALCILRSNFLT